MFTLEEPVRFSCSRLWELQKQFYQGLGPAAWGRKLVPNTVSTNGFMAGAYARVLAAYLSDIVLGRAGDVDAQHPIHIVEIGAGTGKLGYLITRFLAEFAAPLASRKKGPLFRYVLTDAVSANLDAWRRHPRLNEAVDAGLIDFALFDAARDDGMRLEMLGATLESANGSNPLALIANYAFDILPYDVFTLAGGQLHEHRVGLSLPASPAGETVGNAQTMKDLSFLEEDHPFALPYYDAAVQNDILAFYAANLPDQIFTFPTGALTCLERLRRLGGGRLLGLVSDKARFSSSQFKTNGGLGLSLDGAYAATVNLDAVSRAVKAWGGNAFARPVPNSRFDSYAFITAPAPEALGATRNALQDHLMGFNPQAYYSLLSNLRRQGASAGLGPLLAILSLGKPDPAILFRLSDALLELTKDRKKVTPSERQELLHLIRTSWDNRFDLGEESNTAFALARLARRMGDLDLAAGLFQASLDVGGPDAATLYNLALCQVEQGRAGEAKASLQAVLALKPGHAKAAESLARLERI